MEPRRHVARSRFDAAAAWELLDPVPVLSRVQVGRFRAATLLLQRFRSLELADHLSLATACCKVTSLRHISSTFQEFCWILGSTYIYSLTTLKQKRASFS